MNEEAVSPLSESETRAYVWEQIDTVSRAEDKTLAAARALQQARKLQIAQTVLEHSLSTPLEVRRAFVEAALHSGDEALARTAAESLVYLSDSPNLVGLLRECLGMADPRIRQRAIEAFESMTDPNAVSLLATALKDPEQVVKRAAAGTLELIVGSRYRPMRKAVLEALANPHSELFESIVNSQDSQLKRHVAQSMGYAASDRVLELLARLSEDEDPQVRQEATLALAATGTPEAMKILSGRILEADYLVCSSILDILAIKAGSSSKELLDYLKVCMRHRLPDVRRHAVLMLDKFAPEQVKDLLLEAAKDNDFEVAQRAGEILRRMFPARDVDWLADEALGESADSRTLAIWEAGNIGVESDRRTFREAGRATTSEEIMNLLERSALQGSPSDKIHAVTELSALKDIADSPALQKALVDENASVRSLAADSLANTRDAGLLVRTLMEHRDPIVRRRALEALVDNPGGRPEGAGPSRLLTFTLARLAGTELFSYFLKALNDEDEGVVERACDAVQHTALTAGIAPMKETLGQLRTVARNRNASVLIRETAENCSRARCATRWSGAAVSPGMHTPWYLMNPAAHSDWKGTCTPRRYPRHGLNSTASRRKKAPPCSKPPAAALRCRLRRPARC